MATADPTTPCATLSRGVAGAAARRPIDPRDVAHTFCYVRGGEKERNVAESLRLDLCHGCALEAAGISDDGSTVAEDYLQQRRYAFNLRQAGRVQTEERSWRPGLNEHGLTMCSACGPNGKLSTCGLGGGAHRKETTEIGG